MENGVKRKRSQSPSPRPPRGPKGIDGHHSPPRGPRNHERHDRHDRNDRRPGRSHSRSPPRGPRTDRNRVGVRQRSPPRGPRGPRRGSDDYKERPLLEGRMGQYAATRPSNGIANKSSTTVKKPPAIDIMKIDPEAEDENEFRGQMRLAMGFGMFRTTKDTKVPGNDKLYAVRKEKKAEYRQYMNRQGGFNRPLSPSR